MIWIWIWKHNAQGTIQVHNTSYKNIIINISIFTLALNQLDASTCKVTLLKQHYFYYLKATLFIVPISNKI